MALSTSFIIVSLLVVLGNTSTISRKPKVQHGLLAAALSPAVCTCKAVGFFCGGDEDHIIGDCFLETVYNCKESNHESSSDEGCTYQGLICKDGKELGKAACGEPDDDDDDPPEICNCKMAGTFCGSDEHVVGICDPDTIYTCKEPDQEAVTGKCCVDFGDVCTKGSKEGEDFCRDPDDDAALSLRTQSGVAGVEELRR